MATRSKGRPAAKAETEQTEYKTTGINLPSDIWELLNRVAFERAKRFGGRPSVSALLVDLVRRHRKELDWTEVEERLGQSQKLESLGLLAGGIAHDLSNLLVGLIGNASLAQKMLPP